MNRIIYFLRDESGATTVEYGLILALIIAFIISSMTMLGDNIATGFENIADHMSTED